MAPNSITQASPIVRLERQVRRAQAIACGGVLLAAGLLVTGYRGRPVDVVQAERFELLTAQGVRQAIISADTLGFAITLLNARGEPSGILRLSGEPRIAVQTGRGREVAGLGFPQVHHLTE